VAALKAIPHHSIHFTINWLGQAKKRDLMRNTWDKKLTFLGPWRQTCVASDHAAQCLTRDSEPRLTQSARTAVQHPYLSVAELLECGSAGHRSAVQRMRTHTLLRLSPPAAGWYHRANPTGSTVPVSLGIHLAVKPTAHNNQLSKITSLYSSPVFNYWNMDTGAIHK